MDLGIRIGLGADNTMSSGSPPDLANVVAPTISTGLIGATVLLSFGSWDNAETLSGELLRNGVVDVTGLSDGQMLVWVPGDDLDNMVLRITASGAGGQVQSVSSPVVQVLYAPPILTLTGPHPDVPPFDEGTGPQTIDESLHFNGDNLSYTVAGVAASIDANTGLVTISTDSPLSGVTITVTASNSGGQIATSFILTIEATSGAAPVVLYYNSYGTDGTLDFDQAPPSLVHDPLATISGDATAGAMKFGALNNSWESGRIDVPVLANRSHQVLLRNALSGSGSNTEDTFVQLLNSAGTQLWSSPDVGVGTSLVDVPADPAADMIRWSGLIRGDNTGKTYWLHELGIWDVTDSGGFPDVTGSTPIFWAPPAYVGEAMNSIDFAPSFSGIVTSYALSGPDLGAWVGGVLSLTPNAVTTATESRKVTALNGSLQSISDVTYLISVAPTPAVLAATGVVPDKTLEVSRGLIPIQYGDLVSGGVEPFAYSVIAAPSWIRLEAGGIAWGVAPTVPAGAETLTVRITDGRGDSVDITSTVTSITTRSRAGVATSNASTIEDMLRGASAGDVFVLQAGQTYSFANLYQAAGFPEDNPVIITGPATAIINGGGNFNQCSGVILEGVTVRRASMVSDPVADRNKPSLESKSATNLHFYDLTVEGWDEDISAQLPGGWLSSATNAYYGNGIQLWGSGVIDNCTVRKVYEGISTRGGPVGVYNCEVNTMRDDGIIIAQTRGVIYHKVNINSHGGNYLSGDHRDLAQLFSQNPPAVHNCIIDNCFMSTAGISAVQGLFLDQDGWPTSPMTEAYTTADFVVRDTVVLAGANHGFHFERLLRGIAARIVVLPHPDIAFLNQGWLNHRRASQIDFSGCLYNTLIGDAQIGVAGDWSHLVTLTNSIDASTITISDVFANWANTGLAYEDPREAVAAGAAASAARFWIDPAGVWNTTANNAAIGPGWLRDGL